MAFSLAHASEGNLSVVRDVMQHAAKLVGADRFSIFSLDASQGELVASLSDGADRKSVV